MVGTFNLPVQTIQHRLVEQGFTIIPYKYKDYPCLMYVAKYDTQAYENAYITVTEDFETVSIFNLPVDMSEDTFIDCLCGDDSAFEKISKYMVTGKDTIGLSYALGYIEEDKYYKMVTK